jgi:hypothetical protein
MGARSASDEAVALCDEALEFGKRTEGRCYEAETHRVRGKLFLALGRTPLAVVEAEFECALSLARESHCRLLELRAAVSYFQLQRRAGYPARGRQVLFDMTDWFARRTDCPALSEARELLDDLG